MIPEYEKINWSNWYKLDNFVVFDVPNEWVPFNVFTRIERFLNGNWSIPNFNQDRNLTDNIYSNYILIEYSDKNIRDNDIKNNSKINIINPIKSEAVDNDKQLAENVWNFEYNWKYYLVVYPYNALTDENNPNLWLYKWIIIDSDKYFWISEDSENRVKETVDKVDNILD